MGNFNKSVRWVQAALAQSTWGPHSVQYHSLLSFYVSLSRHHRPLPAIFRQGGAGGGMKQWRLAASTPPTRDFEGGGEDDDGEGDKNENK